MKNTITIDGVEYVRADQIISKQTANASGMPYVIVRSREQGVMCGYLAGYEGRTVRLLSARQVWRYDSKFVLPDLAEFGARDPNKCKLSAPVTSGETIMLEACGIIPCTVKGAESLQALKAQEV